jgi:1-acyl-sn-glycerol-3-phosphate acyltransferase
MAAYQGEELHFRVLRVLARWWARSCYRIQWQGIEHIPLEGPAILTPNHVSYLDPIWISIPIRRRVSYMAWDALFRYAAFDRFLRCFHAFPVRIEGHDKSAMRDALEVLESGQALMIFPEGGRTTTGKLLPFKAGAFRLALYTGASVVPVSINGAYRIWPYPRCFPRPTGNIRVVFHEPIVVEKLNLEAEPGALKARARALAEQARDRVASALDPEHLPERLEREEMAAAQG